MAAAYIGPPETAMYWCLGWIGIGMEHPVYYRRHLYISHHVVRMLRFSRYRCSLRYHNPTSFQHPLTRPTK